MPFKIQLINEERGILNVNPDPEGLNSFELELKRSSENDGVFFEFGIGLKFFKESRSFIRDVYEAEGIEGNIEIIIYEYNPNTYGNDKIYTGKLRLKDYEIDQIGVQLNVEQVGFERAFMNLSKVDRTISANENITLIPRKVLKRFQGEPTSSDVFTRNAAITFNFNSGVNNQTRSQKVFVMVDVGSREFDELSSLENGGFSYAVSEIDAIPFLVVNEDEQGLIDIDLTIRNAFSVEGVQLIGGDTDIGGSSTLTPPVTMICYFEHRNKFNQVIEKTQLGTTFNSTLGTNTIVIPFETRTYTTTAKQVNPGDKLYMYYEILLESNQFNITNPPTTIQYNISANADVGGLFDGWNVELNVNTIFPETPAKSALIFEHLDSIVIANTNGQCRLKSDFFGRTDLGYPEDGEGSLLAITNGHFIRQSNDKSLFGNWESLYSSLESIFCLGWGFETDELGFNYVRVEKKSFFYDKTAASLRVVSSADLVKRAKTELYYTQIECGYPKFEDIGTSKSVDEFNTTRKYANSITQATNELKLLSEYRAASYEIEGQRRQQINDETSTLDDENFLLALKRGVSGFELETGADYNSLQNIFDGESAYNIRLRPSQFIENWRMVLSGVLLRSQNKAFDFTFGTKNYEFIVDGLAEDRNIIMINSDALWYCDEIEFETGIRSAERELVKQNPNQLIIVEDWIGNSIEGYLLSSKFTLDKNEGSFLLLKAYLSEEERTNLNN